MLAGAYNAFCTHKKRKKKKVHCPSLWVRACPLCPATWSCPCTVGMQPSSTCAITHGRFAPVWADQGPRDPVHLQVRRASPAGRQAAPNSTCGRRSSWWVVGGVDGPCLFEKPAFCGRTRNMRLRNLRLCQTRSPQPFIGIDILAGHWDKTRGNNRAKPQDSVAMLKRWLSPSTAPRPARLFLARRNTATKPVLSNWRGQGSPPTRPRFHPRQKGPRETRAWAGENSLRSTGRLCCLHVASATMLKSHWGCTALLQTSLARYCSSDTGPVTEQWLLLPCAGCLVGLPPFAPICRRMGTREGDSPSLKEISRLDRFKRNPCGLSKLSFTAIWIPPVLVSQ